jgi:hypothetical protein
MQAQQKSFKPEHHKVMEEKIVTNRGKVLKAFKLRWNPKLTEQAGCSGLDTDIFYPDKDIFSPEEERIMGRMCIECPVMLICLEWGMAHEKSGIWGGTTPYRRQQARRAMGIQVTDPRGISPSFMAM